MSIPFQHSEEKSHGIYGIYQLPAKRLQQQLDRNLSVLVGTFQFWTLFSLNDPTEAEIRID